MSALEEVMQGLKEMCGENQYCCDDVIMTQGMKKRPNEILSVQSVIENVHFIPRERLWKENNSLIGAF